MARSATQTVTSILGGRPIPKIDAYIVDVDGTIAIPAGRGVYQFELAGFDLPNRPVVDLVNMIAEWSGQKIIITTGRQEKFRKVTEQWLDKYILVYDMLLMRQDGDTRPDWQVKRDMYEDIIEPTYAINGVFDDRQQVVDMWRRFGLTCFQVAPGNF